MLCRRRVLHVMRTTGFSGAERHLAQLTADLRELGWASTVVVPTPGPDGVLPFVEALETAGAAVRALTMRYDASIPLLGILARALRSDGQFDVVNTHLIHADWHGGAVARLRGHRPGMPALVTSKHNHDPFRTAALFRPFETAFLRRADASIAISRSLAEFTERWGGVRPEIVLYGLPAKKAPPDVPRRAEGPRRLLAVGRLEPQKGFDVLIDAVATALAGGANVDLRIAGDGSLRDALAARIAGAGIGGRIVLLGHRVDVAELMLQSDLLVHPARWEGFGLVLLEAMRAGLPVLATAVSAIPEVVVDGTTGTLVPPDDHASLAREIVRLSDDDEALRRMGRAAYRRLVDNFTPAATAVRTVDVYERALARAASLAP